MPREYIKGSKKERPGAEAGKLCEGPGCKRTLSSKWLSGGRCCTSPGCQQFFNIGKGKVKEGTRKRAFADISNQHAEWTDQPSLETGQVLMPLCDGCSYEGDCICDIDAYLYAGGGCVCKPSPLLVSGEPFIVLNARREKPYSSFGLPRWSFLVAGIFRDRSSEENENPEPSGRQRWTCARSFAEHGVSGLFDVSNYFGINPSEELEFMVSSLYYTSVLDFMETSCANEGDVAQVREIETDWKRQVALNERMKEAGCFCSDPLVRCRCTDRSHRQWGLLECQDNHPDDYCDGDRCWHPNPGWGYGKCLETGIHQDMGWCHGPLCYCKRCYH